jgi:hypothetical protein
MCSIDILPSSIHSFRPFALLYEDLSPRYGPGSFIELKLDLPPASSLSTTFPLEHPLTSYCQFVLPLSPVITPIQSIMPGVITIASVAALAALSSYIAPSIRHELKVLGVGRSVSVSTIANAVDYVKIEDTTHCEDLHYYAPANLLFTACEDRHTRFGWFPPLGNFEPPQDGTQGSIHVIDPEVRISLLFMFKSKKK